MKNYLIKILKSNKTEKEISDTINSLSPDIVKQCIDEVVSSYNFDYNSIEGMPMKYHQKLISILSKNNYYKEKLININKNDCIVIKNNNFSMVKKLKVDTKKDFLKVLSMFRCEKFFLLNYKKFDFNDHEKSIFKNHFKRLKIINMSLKEKKIFIEKTGLMYPIFNDLDLYDNFNQENYDLFKNSFYSLIPEEEICVLIIIVFLYKIDFIIEKVNKKIYLDFFKEHPQLIQVFENSLLNFAKKQNKEAYPEKNVEKLIGLAEKLIYEEQLKSF